MKTKRPVAAIVLAAGLGTRMKSQRAKVLHELAGKPLIAYPLSILRDLGVDPIVVVVGHQDAEVRAACAPYDVQFVRQQQQRGTGHAARMAMPRLRNFRGDVLLVNADLPLLRPDSFRALIRAHQRRAAAISLLTARVAAPRGFGRIVRAAGRRRDVVRIVEQKDGSAAELAIDEVNVGLYCADARFLFAALAKLRPSKVTRELYLTDVIEAAVAGRRTIADAGSLPLEATQISSRADLAVVEKMLREQINQRWLAAGVTLEDPATTYIGPDVEIGVDTILGPNVILRGNTRIGAGCRFDGTAMLTDAKVGDGVHIKFAVVASNSVIEDEVILGPFAQLRPETVLQRRVHIGNFVEIKKSVIGAGSKASHLSYLGDAEVGPDTNVGAGTITCNYDGFRKHKTTIGARVQIGSDSQLIAPVTVGDDAYISTGSTVRQDVAAGALYFNPKPEMQRPGWTAERRKRERKS